MPKVPVPGDYKRDLSWVSIGLDFRLIRDAKGCFPVTIAGDFNAWATDWGCKKTNKRGQALLEAMSALDVVLLNTGTKTTFVKGEASSIVDLTFVSSNFMRRTAHRRRLVIYTPTATIRPFCGRYRLAQSGNQSYRRPTREGREPSFSTDNFSARL